MSDDLVVRQMAVGPMANFAYLIACPAEGVGAVVDPAWDVAAILRGADEAGVRIARIIATHGHMDHVNALAALQRQTGADVLAAEDEAPSLRRLGPEVIALHDGDEVDVGGHSVRALATPGHTPGSQCLLVEGRLLTGDTLFVGSIGRSDLPGSSPAQLFESLQRLKALDPATIVLPGHHYGDQRTSTIERECRYNPYLRIASLADFLHLMGI